MNIGRKSPSQIHYYVHEKYCNLAIMWEQIKQAGNEKHKECESSTKTI